MMRPTEILTWGFTALCLLSMAVLAVLLITATVKALRTTHNENKEN